MSAAAPGTNRELSSYARVPRAPGPQPTLLGIQGGYPAIQYALADVLGYQVLAGPAALLAGSWYFLNLAGGPFIVTLPLLNSVNDGDAVGFAVDGNARKNNGTVATAGSDLIAAAGLTSATLICNAPNDRFRLVRAAGQWNVI